MATTRNFSNWISWEKRNTLPNISCPGVYAIAQSERSLVDQAFTFRDEIIYFGMTNSVKGLKSRLQQFDNTIKGKRGHGGGKRAWYANQDYSIFAPLLYVSVWHFNCNRASELPEILRVMGEVAREEYRCLADYVELVGHLPRFNDRTSPKGPVKIRLNKKAKES